MIQNCRRSAHGYDVMTEVSGELGKFVVHAESKTPTYHYRKGGWERDYHYFFMDRFGPAFRDELVAFFATLSRREEPSPGGIDALESLRIGVAATRSLKEGRPVKIADKIALAEPIARTGCHCRSKSLEGARSLGAAERLASYRVQRCEGPQPTKVGYRSIEVSRKSAR